MIPPIRDAQNRIKHISCRDAARRFRQTVETAVGGKPQIVTQPEGIDVECLVRFRHLRQHRGNEPVRLRRIVIFEQCIVDGGHHVPARQIIRLGRIECLDPAAAGSVERSLRLFSVDRHGVKKKQKERSRRQAEHSFLSEFSTLHLFREFFEPFELCAVKGVPFLVRNVGFHLE